MQGHETLPHLTRTDARGSIVRVRGAATQEGTTRKQSTFLHRRDVRHFTRANAWRECVQNMIDAIRGARDGTLDGLRFGCVTRAYAIPVSAATRRKMGKIGSMSKHMLQVKSAFIVHDGKHKYGEILVCDDCIHLINYCPNIEDYAVLIQMGNSNKDGGPQSNAGEHGEGSKHAMLRFVIDGFRCLMWFPCDSASVTGVKEFHKIAFALKSNAARADERNTLAFTLSKPEPFQFRDGAGADDANRFHLVVHHGNMASGFDLNDFLLPYHDRIVSPLNTNDFGRLFLEPDMAQKLYIWNLFVQNDSRCIFGYNLFMGVGRDRNCIGDKDIHNGVAYAWNVHIFNHPVEAARFCSRVLCNPAVKSDTIEYVASRRFSSQVLCMIRPHLYGSATAKFHCVENEREALLDEFHSTSFAVLPPLAALWANAVFPVDAAKTALRNVFVALQATPISGPPDVLEALARLKAKNVFCVMHRPDVPVRYAIRDAAIYLASADWDDAIDVAAGVVRDPALFWTNLLAGPLASGAVQFDRRALYAFLLGKPAAAPIDVVLVDDHDNNNNGSGDGDAGADADAEPGKNAKRARRSRRPAEDDMVIDATAIVLCQDAGGKYHVDHDMVVRRKRDRQ